MNRSMLRSSVIALAAVLSVAPLLSAHAAPQASSADNQTIATVNGKAIPKSRADALIAAQAAQGQPDSPELRKMVREELIRREILSQEATKAGYEKNPKILPQLMLARQSVLINAYIGDYVQKHPVSDEQLKKEYETIKLGLGDKEYKARHILVDKEDDAKDIIPSWTRAKNLKTLPRHPKIPAHASMAANWAGQLPAIM